MHALIVVAHPEPHSLSHSIAARVGQGVADAGGTYEIADLAAEGFDPRFGPADLAVHRRKAPPPGDVAAEQARIDRADTLVLVYPVYWWSMPGLLKGWIDRVFSNGWAFEDSPGGKLHKKLGRLKVHLVAIGGVDQGTMVRHGYDRAMATQIDHGIFGYCGAQVVASEWMPNSESSDPLVKLDAAHRLGLGLFQAQREPEAANA
ncbi:NAD(P)H-dependent oxidoreductase [Bordetella petrii]|uniref:NAD(P)H-dependent oxidoreductase n=1 Tax=Bordetella petrii TaxID=94624 RepID=UPI001E2EDB86|nr:NAD(P)H-dependent oxidoreductase [Bordetella petrii]MCD0502474.1 NAD(P)H-dependent oxidoreductase [Bordetella petrii]